jgi:hypothetical protein
MPTRAGPASVGWRTEAIGGWLVSTPGPTQLKSELHAFKGCLRTLGG